MAAVLSHGPSLSPHVPTTAVVSSSRLLTLSSRFKLRNGAFLGKRTIFSSTHFSKSIHFRIRSFWPEDAGVDEAASSSDSLQGDVEANEKLFRDQQDGYSGKGSSFMAKLAIGLGVAATVTVVCISLKQQTPESSLGIGISRLADGLSSSSVATSPVGFTFNAFGYRIVLPEYAPGWIYFWLLMAAGCGLFISEEALNIWVGISLARRLCLDGTWQSFAESFSRNASYIISTVLWVYWGVCISDMIPFYFGKLFRQSGASDDVCSKVCVAYTTGVNCTSLISRKVEATSLSLQDRVKDCLGVRKEKLTNITRAVQRYGNLSGFVERFSLGVRNPTAFLAGAMGVSPECFFAGVCCGGLITLPVQLAIGFLLREHPLVAVASVASVVGIWTVFPYVIAALTSLFLYLQHRYSSS